MSSHSKVDWHSFAGQQPFIQFSGRPLLFLCSSTPPTSPLYPACGHFPPLYCILSNHFSCLYFHLMCIPLSFTPTVCSFAPPLVLSILSSKTFHSISIMNTENFPLCFTGASFFLFFTHTYIGTLLPQCLLFFFHWNCYSLCCVKNMFIYSSFYFNLF